MPVSERPPHHWKTTTFVGAPRLSGMMAFMVLNGPMTDLAFLAYVQQVLAPTLDAHSGFRSSSRWPGNEALRRTLLHNLDP